MGVELIGEANGWNLICDDKPNLRYLLRVFVESQTGSEVCGEAATEQRLLRKKREYSAGTWFS